jgi:hypothetical protein
MCCFSLLVVFVLKCVADYNTSAVTTKLNMKLLCLA